MDDCTLRLEQAGIRVTPLRSQLLAILASAKEHLTSEAIHRIMHRRGSTASLASVYRTLQVFEDVGIVDRLNLGEHGSSYVLQRHTGHYHHIVCTHCGRTAEIGDCYFEEYAEQAARETGFEIHGHQLLLFGLCSDCAPGLKGRSTLKA